MKSSCLILLFSLSAFAETSLHVTAKKLLPDQLQKFKIQATTLTEVEKKWGKANLVEGSDYYWEIDGFKYGLKLSFNNKFLLNSLHYTFVKERPSSERLGKIEDKKHTPAFARYIKIKEGSTEVIIDPVDKTVYSVKLP